jgi:hypothetical protein
MIPTTGEMRFVYANPSSLLAHSRPAHLDQTSTVAWDAGAPRIGSLDPGPLTPRDQWGVVAEDLESPGRGRQGPLSALEVAAQLLGLCEALQLLE